MPQTNAQASESGKFNIIDEALCDGCGDCVGACDEGVLEIVGGKARAVEGAVCDGLGACLGRCPKGALRVEGAEAPCCPGLSGGLAPHGAGRLSPVAGPVKAGASPGEGAPSLANWPIQIRLQRLGASFPKCHTLVIAADCSAFSTPSFHQLFLGQGHPLVLGCPKLDDPISQTDRLTGILVANPGIREIWVPIMEVPCCRGLTLAVSRALANSGRKDSVRVRTFVVGRDGTVGEELPRDR